MDLSGRPRQHRDRDSRDLRRHLLPIMQPPIALPVGDHWVHYSQ